MMSNSCGPPQTFLEGWVELKLQKDQQGWNYIPYYLNGTAECPACDTRSTQPSFVDINSDGKLESCSQSFNNNGGGSYGCSGVDWSASGMSDNNEIFQHELIDYDGDELIDILYTEGYNSNSVWKVKRAQLDQGKIKYPDDWQNTSVKAGDTTAPSSNRNEAGKVDQSMFIDYDNDGITDHLYFKLGGF